MKLGEQSVNGILCVKFVGFMFEACEIFQEVCLAINFISKKELKDALDDLGKQKAVQQVHSVIQMLWILNGFISICKERNVHCRIFCRP